jgi:Domain of unknown function (DUF1996)
MMLRTMILAGGLLLSIAGGSEASSPSPRGTNFFSDCRFSHAAPDDPIVRPGLPGASHPHEFFGNTSTDARSSLASLLGHGTTCTRKADTAAYWVPALYRNGHVVKPLEAIIYYRIRSIDRVHPFPPGLKIVAGNAGATVPQSTRIVFWNCAYPPGPAEPSASVPKCSRPRPRMLRRRSAGYLRLNVNFPDCWDGKRLDSPDHRSHMAYSSRLRCPASHPVKVPSLRLTVAYPIPGGAGLALASGGLYSGHADFFNAWKQGELKRLVEACAAEKTRCSRPGN